MSLVRRREMKYEGVEAATMLEMSITRLRELRQMLSDIHDSIWPVLEDLDDALGAYDDWKQAQEDKEDV